MLKTPIHPSSPLGVIHSWDISITGIKDGFITKITFNPWIPNIEPCQEGTSIGKPPWLVKIILISKWEWNIFLKCKGKKVWNTFEFGRPPLQVSNIESRPRNDIKTKLELDSSENDASGNNASAMYSIFNGINIDEFRRIAYM